MKKINFTKMVASGNDFVVIENKGRQATMSRCGVQAQSYRSLAREICERKYGVGSDGLLVLEKSKGFGIKMRIFNADGSEAEMCGNGARCAALWADSKIKNQESKILKIETKAGLIDSEVNDESVKIKLTDPKNIALDIPLKINGRAIKVNFIDTGVPHTVIFVEGLQKFDILPLGRFIRCHKEFSPRGTNVDFVEALNGDSIKVRTYERGVEDETLACGTGSVASALVYVTRYAPYANQIDVHTKSGEILKVYFEKNGDKFSNVWLAGMAKIVYEGAYNV